MRLKKKSLEKYRHFGGGVQFSIRLVAVMKACTDLMRIPQGWKLDQLQKGEALKLAFFP